jgi:hypothetical protein
MILDHFGMNGTRTTRDKLTTLLKIKDATPAEETWSKFSKLQHSWQFQFVV